MEPGHCSQRDLMLCSDSTSTIHSSPHGSTPRKALTSTTIFRLPQIGPRTSLGCCSLHDSTPGSDLTSKTFFRFLSSDPQTRLGHGSLHSSWLCNNWIAAIHCFPHNS